MPEPHCVKFRGRLRATDSSGSIRMTAASLHTDRRRTPLLSEYKLDEIFVTFLLAVSFKFVYRFKCATARRTILRAVLALRPKLACQSSMGFDFRPKILPSNGHSSFGLEVFPSSIAAELSTVRQADYALSWRPSRYTLENRPSINHFVRNILFFNMSWQVTTDGRLDPCATLEEFKRFPRVRFSFARPNRTSALLWRLACTLLCSAAVDVLWVARDGLPGEAWTGFDGSTGGVVSGFGLRRGCWFGVVGGGSVGAVGCCGLDGKSGTYGNSRLSGVFGLEGTSRLGHESRSLGPPVLIGGLPG